MLFRPHPASPSFEPALLRRLAAGLRFLLPSACAQCGEAGGPVCADCRTQYFSGSLPRCLQCAIPLPGQDGATARCGACLRSPPAFDATIAASDYAAPADGLVLALKFGGRLALAPALARLLHAAVLRRTDLALPTVLAAVPLSRGRLAERGFNQALEIARPLAASLGIALAPRLASRLRETQAQTTLPLEQRRANMRAAFAIPADAAAQVRGAHIGVVDDVMTTGATLDELAGVLKRLGAARVTNLVFARTLPH
ncbi:MAG: double zinc ribbon domain-containing protein [Noviherbaspirillum sp.]